MPIKAVKVGDLLEKIRDDDDCVAFTEKKPAQGVKWRAGVGYMNTDWKMGGDKPIRINIYVKNAVLARGAADPDDEKSQEFKQPDIQRLEISGNSCPELRDFVEEFNGIRDDKIETKHAAWKSDKTLKPMFRTKYSEHAGEELAGTNFKDADGNDDVRIPVVVDFGHFGTGPRVPQGLRGKSKCIVKDFDTGRIVEKNGRKAIEFSIAEVDGEVINDTNSHKFLTKGSVIKSMYISVSSTSKSQQGINTRIEIIEMTVESRPFTGGMERVEDEDDDMLEEMLSKKSTASRSVANAMDQITGIDDSDDGDVSDNIDDE